MHRFLVLGYGAMGMWHAGHLKKSGFADAAGVYDIDPDRRALAREHGFQVFDSMEELLQCEADMAVAATPNESHDELACMLLRTGKHVLVEKPAALNEKELLHMYAEAEKTGKILAVHMNRRFDRDFLAVQNVLTQGLLGSPFRLESRIHGSRGVPDGWRRKNPGGGMLYDWGVHLIDQALLAFQDDLPVRVYCRMSHILEKEVDDGFALTMYYGDGKTVIIEVSTCNFIPMPRFYLCGTTGTAVIRDWREPCQVTQCTAWREEDVMPVIRGNGITKTMSPRDELTTRSFQTEQRLGDPYELLRNFCAAAEGKEELLVKKEQTLSVMRVIDAAFRSAETGSPVEISLR